MKTKYWEICNGLKINRILHFCRRNVLFLSYLGLRVVARWVIELLRDVQRALTEEERNQIADEIESLILRLEVQTWLNKK